MVKLVRSVLPKDIDIKRPEDYQTGHVFDLLYEDCYGKCYICEQIPTSYVVEHLVAHKGNPELQFKWSNMFLACTHCNSVKNKRMFDSGVVDPTEIDPEECISFELQFKELKEVVIIKSKSDLRNKAVVDLTIKLLDSVYNNKSDRSNQKVSSSNLKNRLSKNLRDFYLLIENYKEEKDSSNYSIILDEISRKSMFAAFKRMVVRSDNELMRDFEKALE